jgi:hypothetical protein
MKLMEAEFLLREFDLSLAKIDVSSEEALKNSEIVLLATTDPRELQHIIQGRKERSVVLFFLGNETYDIPKFEYLNKYHKQIRHCFIYNLPKKTPYSVSLKCFFAAIYDGGLFYQEGTGNIIRHAKNGFDFLQRNRKLKINYPASDFPQGYTNTFISELKNLSPDLNGSLLTNNNLLRMSNLQRTHSISFIGAAGSWNRRLALKKMRKIFQNSNFNLVANSWTDEISSKRVKNQSLNHYVSALHESRFTLCPPGNLTNQTFRYLESLLMGSLPILPPATIQDNHLWNSWSEFTKPVYFSWTANLKRAKIMQEEERMNLVAFALGLEKIRIQNVKNTFCEALG